MIRAFVATLVLLSSSTSFAAYTCDTKQILKCTAVYQAYDNTTDVLESQAQFADQNQDESSSTNCSSKIYFNTGSTSIFVYASQDMATSLVSYFAQAGQVEYKDGGTSVEYSNTLKAQATPGMIMNLGALQLPTAIQIGTGIGKTVYVGCTAK